MQLDPEDYAFMTCYSPARVGKQAVRLATGLKGRLISLLISLGFVVFFWWRMGRPTHWDPLTRAALILFGVAVLANAAVGIVAWRGAAAPRRRQSLILHVVAVALVALPLAVVWATWWRLHTLSGYDEFAPVRPTWFLVLLWGYFGLAVLATACWVAAVVASVRWARRPGALGWIARQLSQGAVIAGPALVAATAAVVLLVQVRLNSYAWLPTVAGWTGDLGMWLLLALVTITLVTLATSTLQVVALTVFAATLVGRPALRVDPLGLVIDDAAGPTRVHWPDVVQLGAKAHTPLPGPELWIKRVGGPDWFLPLGFLDAMPGTIDSAVRAHTANRRTLDLARLNRVW